MVDVTSEAPVRPPEQAPPVAPRAWNGRAFAVALCLVLAAVLTTPACLAYWAQRTLNDPTRYVQTVGPLVDSARVQEAVAAKVTTAIEKQVDVEALLNEAFAGVIEQRPRLEMLVGPLAGAVNGLIETQVRNFLASDEFRQFWIAANTRLQQGLIRILKSEPSGAISQQGDDVVLDVSAVIDEVKQRLAARGLTMIENLPVPDTDRQVVLFEAPQLEKARNAYTVLNPVAQWLLLLVAVLYVGAIVLSRRRPRTTVTVGVLLVANALLLTYALSVGRQMFIDSLSDTEFAAATTVLWATLLSFLERGKDVMLWLGVVLVVAGCYLGRNSVGTAVRTTVCDALERIGAALGNGPVTGPGRWVGANVRWLRIVVVVIGGVVLVWGNEVTPTQLFWATVVVMVLLAVLQVLVGAGRTTRTGDQPVSTGGVSPSTPAIT